MESSSDTIDTEEKKPEDDGKPSLPYWRSQLEAYDNAADPWKRDVDMAWDEYLNVDGRNRTKERPTSTHFPIFWASVRTIQPAFYSRTPVIVTEKTFKEMRDPVARLAALCVERLGKYAVREGNFDRAMTYAVTHFIMAEKASVRVIFESAITENRIRTNYQQVNVPSEGADGQMMLGAQYVDDQGQQYHGQPDQDDEGFYTEETEQSIDYLKCDTEPMNYRDYRHTPNARHQGEIDWIAFDTLLTRTEAEEAFGEDADKLTYGPAGNSKDKDRSKEIKGLPSHYATITEIWDKKKRKVYYYSPGYNEWLTHQNNPNGDDPYKLKNFFPCAPFIMGTQGQEDMFTAPAYVQLKDFIDQVHGAFDRVRRLLLAMKKAGAFDASKTGLSELNALTSEGQFIAIEGLEQMLGPQGSLDQLIYFFPTDQIAKAVVDLKTAMNDFEQKIYDLWGIPDIYRGITDPQETLGAQQLKGKHMSVRFSWLQREVQRLARDTIEIMCDLYLQKCPDHKLAEIMGFQFMQPQEQQIFPQVLQMLKNDTERCIRLEIETDSTITQNMNADIEQKNYLAKTLFEGLSATKDVSPAFMPVAAKAVELSVQALQQGKLVEDDLSSAFDQMQQAAANPPPPPPDPAMLKAQADIEAAQKKAELDAQLLQQKTQNEAALENQRAQAQIAVEERQTMADIAREDRRAQAKIASDAAMADTKMKIAMLTAQVDSASEQQKAQLKRDSDDHSAKLDMITSSYQAKLDMILASAQAEHKAAETKNKEAEKKEKEPKEPKQPPIHINIEAAKPKKFTIKRDGQNSTIEPEE